MKKNYNKEILLSLMADKKIALAGELWDSI